jgi:hypothetical protein
MTFRACGAHKSLLSFAKDKKNNASAAGVSMRGTSKVARTMGIKHALCEGS